MPAPQSDDSPPNDKGPGSHFEEQSNAREPNLLAEFYLFLKEHKKWWMIPLVGSLLLLGLVSWIAASGAAPFIYTLF